MIVETIMTRTLNKCAAYRSAALFAVCTLAIFSFSGCHKVKKVEKPAHTKQAAQKPEPAAAAVLDPTRSPLAGETFRMLAPEVLGSIAGTPELKALRKRGIIRGAIPCTRPPLCSKNKYNAAFGFEPQLLSRIARQGLGVKENIVDPGGADADVQFAVSCGAPGGPPIDDKEKKNSLMAGPYYYSADDGWFCIRVLRGGRHTADALDRILKHFYDTGAFQDIFRQWMNAEAPS